MHACVPANNMIIVIRVTVHNIKKSVSHTRHVCGAHPSYFHSLPLVMKQKAVACLHGFQSRFWSSAKTIERGFCKQPGECKMNPVKLSSARPAVILAKGYGHANVACHKRSSLCRTIIKIINPINSGSLEEHFQHLNILCLLKLYSFSVGKFMHSYHNKLLPNHFDEYFVPLSSIHYHSTRLATSKNLFLPRVNSSSGKCSLKFIGPKVWSSIPDDIKFSTTFTFKWKLKKNLLHEKNSQLWTLATFPLSRTKYCVF